MANRNSRRQSNFEPIEFVNIRLDDNDKADYDKWAKTNSDKLIQLVANFSAEGNKLSITWDDTNACFIASATCKDEKSANHNMSFSSRSDDWFEALVLLVYKATVKAKGGDWQNVSTSNNWG